VGIPTLGILFDANLFKTDAENRRECTALDMVGLQRKKFK
jgi:hypothetical protein